MKKILSDKGFLLIEVILSTVLLSSVLLLVMATFSTSKNLAIRSRELFQYGFLVPDKLFEIDEKGELPQSTLLAPEDGNVLLGEINTMPAEQNNLHQVSFEFFSRDNPEISLFTLQTFFKKRENP